MNSQRKKISKDGRRLAGDARAMMDATADVAGRKIGDIRESVAAGTRVAGRAMHRHPYQTAVIGVGCGALIGFLIVHSCSSDNG